MRIHRDEASVLLGMVGEIIQSLEAFNFKNAHDCAKLLEEAIEFSHDPNA